MAQSGLLSTLHQSASSNKGLSQASHIPRAHQASICWGAKGTLAPVPVPALAVMSTLPQCWLVRICREWKELVQAVFLLSRYRVAGCQGPQEGKKGPDSQLLSYHRWWPVFVCRSRQRDEERSPEIPCLAANPCTIWFHPLFPAKSHSCLIPLTVFCLLSSLGLHLPITGWVLPTYFYHKTQLKSQLQDATVVTLIWSLTRLYTLTG